MHNSKNKHLFILTIGWLIINLLVYKTLGIKYAIDTARFDAESSAWLSGTFEFSYHFWYTGYIAILALCKFYFHSINSSIVIQCSLSLISILLFYSSLCKILTDTVPAFIASLLVIFYIPIQQWNVCLLTESFYISTILLFIWAYSFENNKLKWTSLFIIALVATTLRPNGGIILITFFSLVANQFISIQNRKYIYGLGIIATIALLLLLNTSTTIFYRFVVSSFNKGEVICGYSGWTVPIKSQTNVDDSTGSIIKMIQLLIAHPLEFAQLSIYRSIALWTDVRMYYRNLHNTFIILFLLPAYICAAIGMFQYRKIYSGIFLTTIVYAGLNTLLIMITYADWDGRFLVPLLPIIFIWTGLGIHYVFMNIYATKHA